MRTHLPNLVLAFAAIAKSVPLKSPGILHEKRRSSAIPGDADIQVRRVDPETVLPIRIALKQQNLDRGYDFLMEVSHPSSPTYGQHCSPERVDEVFAPSSTSTQAVKAWLRDNTAIAEDEIVERKGWLALDLPAREAERLFNAAYFEYGGSRGNVRVGCER